MHSAISISRCGEEVRVVLVPVFFGGGNVRFVAMQENQNRLPSRGGTRDAGPVHHMQMQPI